MFAPSLASRQPMLLLAALTAVTTWIPPSIPGDTLWHWAVDHPAQESGDIVMAVGAGLLAGGVGGLAGVAASQAFEGGGIRWVLIDVGRTIATPLGPDQVYDGQGDLTLAEAGSFGVALLSLPLYLAYSSDGATIAISAGAGVAQAVVSSWIIHRTSRSDPSSP